MSAPASKEPARDDGPEDGFYRRVAALVGRGLRQHRRHCARLVLLGFIETVAQAGALLLLIPLVRQVGQPQASPASLGVSMQALDPFQYMLYVAAVAALFTIAVRLNYLVFSLSYSLSGSFTVDCAESVVDVVRAKLQATKLPRRVVRRIVNRALFTAASSCGVLFRRVLLSLNDCVMLVIFAAILVYLSPIITAAVVLLSLIPVALYLRSFRRIASQADQVVAYKKEARREADALIDMLARRDSSADDVRRIVRDLYDAGRAGDALSGKLSMRRQMRGSGAIVELITPISVVVIAVVLYFSQTLALDLALVLAYYLILRRTIAAATQIADGLVTINRVYPGLRDFIVASDPSAELPDWWVGSTNADGIEDDN